MKKGGEGVFLENTFFKGKIFGKAPFCDGPETNGESGTLFFRRQGNEGRTDLDK